MPRLIVTLFFVLFSGHLFAQEIVEINGKVISFEAESYEIPLKARVAIKNRKRKTVAIARVISAQGDGVYSAKIVKKKKRAKIRIGQRVHISKKFKIGVVSKSKSKRSDRKKKKTKSDKKNYSWGIRLHPTSMFTGANELELEFSRKGSPGSFAVGVGSISFEDSGKDISGLSIVTKYNHYFSGRSISKGLYASGIFSLSSLEYEGAANSGDILNVSVYGMLLGGTINYQLFLGRFVFSAGAGGGFNLLPGEVEGQNSSGQTVVLEIPNAGFTPILNINLGYMF
ncbi:MAG: hypothetical protein ACPGJV_06435 [Bacteriovoracaceae bacterium]